MKKETKKVIKKTVVVKDSCSTCGTWQKSIIEEGDNMTIELEDEMYEANIELVQLEITGSCNMHCKHCRAADMPKKIINK